MPVEAKPLFRPDVLRPHIKAFQLPARIDQFRGRLSSWAEMIASGRVDEFNEEEILDDFISDFFYGVLGYLRAVDSAQRFTIRREKYIEVDGKYADAVIGEFLPSGNRFVAAVEGKGPKDPLERPFRGRKKSAVDQGYGYAINLPCDWVIVTSIRQTRLYYKGADQQTYEQFETESLARDDNQLRRFVYLLGAERVVPAVGKCHLYDLLHASERVGKELTKEYYVLYAGMRESAFEHLCRANPSIPQPQVLEATQKLLDRILFCAFCEDRGLLNENTIQDAYKHEDPYNPRPIWENFRGLFRAVNTGSARLSIPAYNGGLFADDPVLDSFTVPDEVCRYFKELADYDYRPPHQASDDEIDDGSGTAKPKLVDVDILGHIFEQSISDLELILDEIEGRTQRLDQAQHASRRKKEGAFYTPPFITRFILEQALGKVLGDRFDMLRRRIAMDAEGTAKQSLADPSTYDLEKLNRPQRAALVRFWEQWQEELSGIRILDPACGSGAFLIEAFDQLHHAYQRSNDRLEELRGFRTLFDLDRQILQNNLYGVDLNAEAVQICRLSLWIKTAQRGKPLTALDHTIRIGNSVVGEDHLTKPLDWEAAFPEISLGKQGGGFDVVVGNPPYIRGDWLTSFKPYFKTHYATYDSNADIYVYFYEIGFNLLKPGGRLSFVVTNKWMKAAYAEPLRQFFAEQTWVESFVNLGHAKQVFEDADVFPSIIVLRRPNGEAAPSTSTVCAIPREQLRVNDLSVQIAEEGHAIERARLTSAPWIIEPPKVMAVFNKIRGHGIPLRQFAGSRIYTGIKTGCNEAFLIKTTAERDAIIAADPDCTAIIRPYRAGEHMDRWAADWDGTWMIALKSSRNHTWPWSEAGDRAEEVFRETYPSLYERMKGKEEKLRSRADKGVFWWEMRSCAYWQEFERPKLIYQEIQYHPSYGADRSGDFANNKVMFIPKCDLYLLGVLNSALMWWHNWWYLPHMKDEALTPVIFMAEDLPIAEPTPEIRSRVEASVTRLVEIAARQRDTRRELHEYLRLQHGIVGVGQKLQNPFTLELDDFLAEIVRIRGRRRPLSLRDHRTLRETYSQDIAPVRELTAEATGLERDVNSLIIEAYGLSGEDMNAIWETAPPRMPSAVKPEKSSAG